MSENTQSQNKKPVYKRWWFWVILILVISAVGRNMEDKKSNSPSSSTYSVTNVERATNTNLGKMPVTGTPLKYATQEYCNDCYQFGYNTGKGDRVNGKAFDNFYLDSDKKNEQEGKQCYLLGYDHGYYGKYPDPGYPMKSIITPEYMDKICNESNNVGFLVGKNYREHGMKYDNSMASNPIPYDADSAKVLAHSKNCYILGYNKGFYGQ